MNVSDVSNRCVLQYKAACRPSSTGSNFLYISVYGAQMKPVIIGQKRPSGQVYLHFQLGPNVAFVTQIIHSLKKITF